MKQARKDGPPKAFYGIKMRPPADEAMLGRLYDAQPPNLSKVPFVKRGYVTATFQSRCANDQVIEADHFAENL
jgi:hypothetical protein